MEPEVEIKLLREALKGHESMCLGFAVLLWQSSLVEPKTMIEMLEVMAALAATKESEAAALPIMNVISMLRALVDGEADPKLALLASVAMYADAGKERKTALQWWLSHGTSEEIADDIRQLLRKLWNQAPDQNQT